MALQTSRWKVTSSNPRQNISQGQRVERIDQQIGAGSVSRRVIAPGTATQRIPAARAAKYAIRQILKHQAAGRRHAQARGGAQKQIRRGLGVRDIVGGADAGERSSRCHDDAASPAPSAVAA